jgi:hypothetical protein
MTKYLLLIYLRDDPLNTLEKRIEHMQTQERFPSLEGRDGVILLSDNAVVFDQTKSHTLLIELCAALLRAKLPYLLIPIESTDAWLVAGTLPPGVKSALSSLNVSCVSSWLAFGRYVSI